MKLGKINFKKLETNVYFAKKDKVLYIFDEDVNDLFNLSYYSYLSLKTHFKSVDKHIELIKDEVEILCICQWIKYDFPEENPAVDLARFAEALPKLSTIIHSSSIEIQNVPQHVKVLECFDLWDMIREAEGKGSLREAEFYCILEGATDTVFGTLQYAEFLERQARFAEAEKQYLLACQCDHPGDPLAAYGRFLAGQGRYAESLECLRDTWEGYYDTMPREAAICFLEDQLDNPASPFWNLLDRHEFHDMLERYVARGGKKVDEIISSRAENAVGTDYGSEKDYVKYALCEMYLTGRYSELESVDLSEYIDVEKGIESFVKYLTEKKAEAKYGNYNLQEEIEFLNVSEKITEKILLRLCYAKKDFEAAELLFRVYLRGKLYSVEMQEFIEFPELQSFEKALALNDSFEGALWHLDSLPENPEYLILDECLIENRSKTLILGNKNGKIPQGVTAIAREAFLGFIDLESITIPESVTSIGESCFDGCKNLESITIPESVTSLGKGCFSDCVSLKSITIPESVTFLGEDCFENCENLTIFAAKGSYAAKWAKENETKFKAI